MSKVSIDKVGKIADEAIDKVEDQATDMYDKCMEITEKVNDPSSTSSDFWSTVIAHIIWIVIAYCTLIKSGFLSDTFTGFKYDNPSEYFSDGKPVQIAIVYSHQFFWEASGDITITLNGIEIATLKEEQYKVIVINLEENKTYRLRAKQGLLCSKVKFNVSEDTYANGLSFQYDDGRLTDLTNYIDYHKPEETQN